LISGMRGLSRRYGCPVPRLGHVILFVSDLVASVGFYRDVAGLEHRFTDAGYAEFGTGPTRLALYERRRAEWLTGHPVLPGPAGEIVLIVEDVDAVADALRTRGIPLLGGPADRSWGHRTLHIADPDGFVVEFAQEIPRARSRRVNATGAPAK
jgi:lactoylglutathione lyase